MRKFSNSELKDIMNEIDTEVNSSFKTNIIPNNKGHLYRPLNFDDYIGQQKAKNILKAFITGSRKFKKPYPHTLIHGNAGTGKTTLARIIANQLGVEWSELLAQDINIDEFLFTINQVNGGIIFLDEVHRMKRDTVEQLYSLMEDFMWNGSLVEPFTLIGATTEIGEIIKTRRPFYERFKVIIELEDYTVDDIYQIINKYVNKTYPDETKVEADLRLMSKNSRVTPRRGIKLSDYLFYSGLPATTVLEDNDIIDNGYTYKDLKTLQYLRKINKPIGIDCLALYLDIPIISYNYEIEPYLIKTECINRTSRGRVIAPVGLKLITHLESIVNQRK
jgi:holliday junction DNA helicase RuvB